MWRVSNDRVGEGNRVGEEDRATVRPCALRPASIRGSCTLVHALEKLTRITVPAVATISPSGSRLTAHRLRDRLRRVGRYDAIPHIMIHNDGVQVLAEDLRRLDEDQFRDFTFSHSAEMLLKANPSFFKGTALEGEAAELLTN